MQEKDIIEKLIENALAEDIGEGDRTTSAIIDKDKTGLAQIVAKQKGILAGMNYAITSFSILDSDTRYKSRYENGDTIHTNDIILEIKGRISSILKVERTALNLLAHLSGISTLTAKYVKQISGTRAKITDTRKTTPLWRKLEKEAVQLGGGVNHRMGLFDRILIKENHILAAGGIGEAVNKCKKYLSDSKLDLPIEVETTNFEQVHEALSCRVDKIMLDNMSVIEMREAVSIIAGKALVEASGGITLENVRSIAETGVDLISIGALTHSAPSFDFSLLVKDV